MTDSTVETARATPVKLVAKPDQPIACTLEAEAMPDRLADWKTALAPARSRVRAGDGTVRLEFNEDIQLAPLAELVAAEQRCCAFFSFAITVDARGIALEVRAPDGAEEIVESLFGPSA